jgi:hypothetical protein
MVTTLLESEVVLRADAGERRELFASEAGHAATTDGG